MKAIIRNLEGAIRENRILNFNCIETTNVRKPQVLKEYDEVQIIGSSASHGEKRERVQLQRLQDAEFKYEIKISLCTSAHM